MKNQAAFRFGNTSITFEFDNDNVMVNATEMSKVFDKEVAHFMENERTKRFINACLKTRNSEFLMVKTRDDLVQSKQRSGTWMHRILALKFAAWLNEDFEIWVYKTIDTILLGKYQKYEKSLRESADRKKRIEALQKELAEISPDIYEELQELISQEKKEANLRGRKNREQIEMFMENISEN